MTITCDIGFNEGWGIFQNTDDEHEPFELNKLDDPASLPELGIDEPVFDDDVSAWEFVIAKAMEGSTLHNEALLFLAEQSPGEIVHIALWLGGQLPCPCVTCTYNRSEKA
jgi:hypothetical protein